MQPFYNKMNWVIIIFIVCTLHTRKSMQEIIPVNFELNKLHFVCQWELCIFLTRKDVQTPNSFELTHNKNNKKWN